MTTTSKVKWRIGDPVSVPSRRIRRGVLTGWRNGPGDTGDYWRVCAASGAACYVAETDLRPAPPRDQIDPGDVFEWPKASGRQVVALTPPEGEELWVRSRHDRQADPVKIHTGELGPLLACDEGAAVW